MIQVYLIKKILFSYIIITTVNSKGDLKNNGAEFGFKSLNTAETKRRKKNGLKKKQISHRDN